ncbi:Defensin [Rhynchospora pubera]|uniref:Defensin n=1 Tax=Rhynchospora pubera TaxID=906938 RepID=A0AAV8DZU2_9POAL|nr:Defensin [Rhynchospora pubera]
MLPVLLLFLLIAATEIGPVMKAEARHCLSQSHQFKGACFSHSNCANVCHNEGFPGGECKTDKLERKCYCKKVIRLFRLVRFGLGLFCWGY